MIKCVGCGSGASKGINVILKNRSLRMKGVYQRVEEKRMCNMCLINASITQDVNTLIKKESSKNGTIPIDKDIVSLLGKDVKGGQYYEI